MWATDATVIATVEDGKVWLFGVVEHWNAELVGWHVAKRGTRFEATQAVGMAVRQEFGHVSADAARGVALRHDHGSTFMSEHFQKQIRSWGITPSFAFVGEPQTNGVIERFFRTLKEQVVYGRIYQTIDEVRDAVRSLRRPLQRRLADRKERPPKPKQRSSRLEPGDAQRRRLTPTLCPKNRARYMVWTNRHLAGEFLGLGDNALPAADVIIERVDRRSAVRGLRNLLPLAHSRHRWAFEIVMTSPASSLVCAHPGRRSCDPSPRPTIFAPHSPGSPPARPKGRTRRWPDRSAQSMARRKRIVREVPSPAHQRPRPPKSLRMWKSSSTTG